MGKTVESLSVGPTDQGGETRKNIIKLLRTIADRLELGENPVFALLEVVPLGGNRTAIDLYQNHLSAFALSMMAFDFMALVQQQAMREIKTPHCAECERELADIAYRAGAARKLVGTLRSPHAN